MTKAEALAQHVNIDQCSYADLDIDVVFCPYPEPIEINGITYGVGHLTMDDMSTCFIADGHDGSEIIFLTRDELLMWWKAGQIGDTVH